MLHCHLIFFFFTFIGRFTQKLHFERVADFKSTGFKATVDDDELSLFALQDWARPDKTWPIPSKPVPKMVVSLIGIICKFSTGTDSSLDLAVSSRILRLHGSRCRRALEDWYQQGTYLSPPRAAFAIYRSLSTFHKIIANLVGMAGIVYGDKSSNSIFFLFSLLLFSMRKRREREKRKSCRQYWFLLFLFSFFSTLTF